MASLGRYSLIRMVGKGGMAEIWKARFTGPSGFEKVLAIKKILPEFAEEDEFVAMFVQEAKLVADLTHTNLVQVFDFGEIEGTYFLAMEYVPGTNCAKLLSRLAKHSTKLPDEVALYITLEACRGLAYAHSRIAPGGKAMQLVHRDVSPQNLLLSFSGDVKVTDFGIAKVADAIGRTSAGHLRGKLPYMSPEQAATHPLDRRSDLFSLGLVLYEMVSGRRLFGSGASEEIYARIIAYDSLNDEDLDGISESVRGVLRLALQADPAARFQDANQMELMIGALLGLTGVTVAKQVLSTMLASFFPVELEAERMGEGLGPEVSMGSALAVTPATVSTSAPGMGVVEALPSRADPIPIEPGTQTLESENFQVKPRTSPPASPSRPGVSPPASPSRPQSSAPKTVPPKSETTLEATTQTQSSAPKPDPTFEVNRRERLYGTGKAVDELPKAGPADPTLPKIDRSKVDATDERAEGEPRAGAREAEGRPSRVNEVRRPTPSRPSIATADPTLIGTNPPDRPPGRPPDRPSRDNVPRAVEEDPTAKPWNRPMEERTAPPSAVTADRRSGTDRSLPRPKAKPWKGPAMLALLGIGAVAAGLVIAGKTELFYGAEPTPYPKPTTNVAQASPVRTAASSPRPVTTSVTIETVRETPTAKPVKTRTVAVARPSPAETSVLVPLTGKLHVTAKPWVEVWVDGKRIARDTPLRNHSLSAGRHTYRVVNPDSGFSKEGTFEVAPDGEVRLFVDVPSKKVTVSN